MQHFLYWENIDIVWGKTQYSGESQNGLAMEKGFTSGRYQDGWQGQWPLSLGKPEVSRCR
jgi:hypothetical protein